MASLRDMVSEYQDDLRNGIAWLAFWREGRSWQAEAFHLDLDDTLYPEDRARLAEIQAADPQAVVVNGYYSGYLGEEMNVAELVAGVRHHYDNGLNNISPFIAPSIAPSMIGRYSSGHSFSLWPTRWRCSLSERSTSGLKYRSTGSPQVLISWITTGRLGIVPLFSMLARYRHSIPTISASALRARRRAFRAAFTSAPKVSKPGQSSTLAI